jgi:2-polyprenyl-6-methoxyphenol hydroxylase-like FAD-dependent oxidoreductase
MHTLETVLPVRRRIRRGAAVVAYVEADVCVVGAGPAGLTLGLELARRGRRVTVLEQKAGFERSFRGEAMSPDAVWLLNRLGVFEHVRDQARPTRRMEVRDGGRRVFSVDFTPSIYESPQPMEIPQPPLLTAMARLAAAHPGFTLLREHAGNQLTHSGGRVTGVVSSGPDGDVEVRAPLTVIADGRYTRFRTQAGLAAERLTLDRDVIWLRLPRPASWDQDTYAVRIAAGAHMVLIPTVPDQLRIGFNIPKGALRQWRAQGMSALYQRFDQLAPELSETVREHINTWSDMALLDIFTAVVPSWSAPGVVLIGDAAHTLSPILGLGVHHALVDAVTLAPLVDKALSRDKSTLHASREASDEGLNEALDEAGREFQRLREPAVNASRAVQLRQEHAFAVNRPAAVAIRRLVYRFLDRSGPVKRRVLTGLYYGVQSAVRDGRMALELSPPAARETERTGAAAR